ncbi:hypothetical protein JOB18_030997 [Solea senegalensis]|uniref:Fanconi anemia group B protein n=1 Tax=Solea senegalensis TaxID=28829 RepID=A0AAV6RCK8_SOLSE|nr:Fanconi anemia group B protein [Solea senegalensis]KAG7503036.1 hypothetical protein JOB18_030997 [Solea senegalensis]
MMEISHPEKLYRNRNRVSFCGNIILFEDSGERGELIFCSLSFEQEKSWFLQAGAGAAVIGRKTQSVEIVKCKCVTDFQKRVTSACVLVTQKSVKRERFKYTLLTLNSSRQLETRIEFKLPYEIKEDVSILQGPTVLWSHAGHLYYTSVQTGEVRQLPAWFSNSVVGELPLSKGQTFVLQVQTEHNLSGSQTPGYFIQNGHEFDGTMILPHPYVCITKCMLVLSADRVEGALKSAVVIAATSNQQLVYIQNGKVKEVCPLPFEGPEDILLVNAGGNGCLLVVSFRQGHVCAVWKETFQIASHWSGVSSVHVDDFLRCGTDQILLIFKDGSVTGQPPESFLITDLCGILYSRGQDTGAPKQSPAPESNLLTLQALESRLQSGLTVLQELQGEVRVKQRVIQQSVQALTDVVSDRETVLTQPVQEGLVALWECDDESKDEPSDEKMQDTPAVSSKPHIDKLWHRIAEDRIVVGLILTTDSSVPAASVSLSILTETGQSSTPAVIQTQSQVLCLPTPCPSSSSTSFSSSAFTLPEPAAKRSKQHNASTPNELTTCKMAVTAVTRLSPLLNSGCVKCHVMLHYVQRQDTFSFMSNPTPVVLHCGQVAVDIHSDFQTQLLRQPKLKADEVKEDLLSLLTLLDRWVFHIDSHDQSLGDIDGWIQKRVGCERIDVSPQYLLLNSARPSSVMLLHWNQINPFCGELSVHSSQLQTLQFLDSLLAYLPVSCIVQPAKGTRWQYAAHIFSLALEKEVVSLRDCVSSLLTETEQEGDKNVTGHGETPEPTSVEGLQRCREVWQQDKKRIRMMLSPLVDMGRYRQLIQSVCKVQLDGDTAALLEIQRALLH